MPDHDDAITQAFTGQAASFNVSPVQNAAEVLDAIVAAATPAADERWLDAACGPGIVTRALAPHVSSVLGVDLTPAMVDLARAEATRVGAVNAAFTVGDATALDLPDDAFDGAVTRYALHHVPRPERVLSELSRVVRPGGRIVVVDHLADEDRDDFAWAAEVERLRDPSHWASLTPDAIDDLAGAAGLRAVGRRTLRLALDLDEWLQRGTDEPVATRLVGELLDGRPGGTARFAVDGRRLRLEILVAAYSSRTSAP